MSRSFNYTGRVKISRDKFSIRVIDDPDGGPASFTADLTGLGTLGLSPKARVVVEPYVKLTSMRFDYGALGAIAEPPQRALTEIDLGSLVQFRIKIIDTEMKPGRLLAFADQVRPKDEEADDQYKSIIILKEENLVEEIWRVDVSRDSSPVLMLNNRVPNLKARLMDDPVLQGAMFSCVVRDVIRVLLVEDPDVELQWVKDWYEFAEALLGEELKPTSDYEEGRLLTQRIVDAYSIREGWATAALPSDDGSEAEYE
jgi:hypothetical protein